MSKKLATDHITNELENSSFFPKRAVQPDNAPALQQTTKVTEKRPAVRMEGVPPPVPRPVPRTGPLVPKKKRPIVQRKPFDIYEDQYLTLRRVSADERDFVNGRGMSQMVRDALDAYFKAHGISLEELPE